MRRPLGRGFDSRLGCSPHFLLRETRAHLIRRETRPQDAFGDATDRPGAAILPNASARSPATLQGRGERRPRRFPTSPSPPSDPAVTPSPPKGASSRLGRAPLCFSQREREVPNGHGTGPALPSSSATAEAFQLAGPPRRATAEARLATRTAACGRRRLFSSFRLEPPALYASQKSSEERIAAAPLVAPRDVGCAAGAGDGPKRSPEATLRLWRLSLGGRSPVPKQRWTCGRGSAAENGRSVEGVPECHHCQVVR